MTRARSKAAEVPSLDEVQAGKIQHLDITKIRPREINARTHSEAQIDQIAASIVQFGFTNPILVDESWQVIAGHGRLKAALQLGRETVPAIIVTGLTEAQCRALVIADNKLAENAGWDFALLTSELQELRASDFDLAVVGFSSKELDALIGAPGEAIPPEGFREYGDDIATEHHCPKCGYEWSGKA